MKKILIFILLGFSSLIAFPPGDMLVKITYEDPKVVDVLQSLQNDFLKNGIRFSWMPRKSQFHTTLAYIEKVPTEDVDPTVLFILKERIGEAMQGRLRATGTHTESIEQISDIRLGKLALFGQNLVVLIEGKAKEILTLAHNNIVIIASDLGPRVSEKFEYVPHINLGIIQSGDTKKAEKLIEEMNAKPPFTLEPFIIEDVWVSYYDTASSRMPTEQKAPLQHPYF